MIQTVRVTMDVVLYDSFTEWPADVTRLVESDMTDPHKDEVSYLAAFLRKTLEARQGIVVDSQEVTVLGQRAGG